MATMTKELCDEKMKGTDEKLDEIRNNDLPHIRNSIIELDDKVSCLEKKVDKRMDSVDICMTRLETNQGWTNKGIIGIFTFLGGLAATIIFAVIKGWI